MDDVFSQSKNFFDLPMDEKMKLLRNEKNRGYTPILDEILDRDNQVDGMFLNSLILELVGRHEFVLVPLNSYEHLINLSCQRMANG